MSRVTPPPLPTLGYFCLPYESPMILTFIPFPSLQYVEDEIQGMFKTVVYVKIWHLLIDTAILYLNLSRNL